MPVDDKNAAVDAITREKATSDPGSVGAPMSGVVIEVRVKEGQEVKKGDVLCVQSAMKVRIWCPCRTSKPLITSSIDGKRGLCTSIRSCRACCLQGG